MDSGHIYPSEYALKFPHRTDHPATWQTVVDELQERYPLVWPNLIGSVFAHREASTLAAVWALDAALAEPKLTRWGLRQRMLAALAAIAEGGPEAIP